MKIRNGFVSNSSSSSFIIGLGHVNDEEKFKEWSKKFPNALKRREINTFKIYDIPWNIDENSNTLNLEAFDGNTVSVSKNESDKFVVLDFTGPHDDSYFWDGNDMNYDIELNEIADEEIEVFLNEVNSDESGISNFDYTYGAGRNG